MKTKSIVPQSIDDYLKPLPKDVRAALETLRKVIKSVAPNAEEVISYNMPAFKYYGMLVYFAAFKNHCSLFPANSSLTIKMKEELKPYKNTKGTIQFAVDNPLPTILIKRIIKLRMKENEERESAKQLKSLADKKKKLKKSAHNSL